MQIIEIMTIIPTLIVLLLTTWLRVTVKHTSLKDNDEYKYVLMTSIILCILTLVINCVNFYII